MYMGESPMPSTGQKVTVTREYVANESDNFDILSLGLSGLIMVTVHLADPTGMKFVGSINDGR